MLTSQNDRREIELFLKRTKKEDIMNLDLKRTKAERIADEKHKMTLLEKWDGVLELRMRKEKTEL